MSIVIKKIAKMVDRNYQENKLYVPEPKEKGNSLIVFACGWFWGPQSALNAKQGVKNTIVGYTKADNEDETKAPNYKSACNGDGNMEAVLVEYDEKILTTSELLDWFYDRGSHSISFSQYGSAIFYTSESQGEIVINRHEKELKTKELQ